MCTSHGFDYDTLEQGVLAEIKKIVYFISDENLESKILKKYKDNDPFNTYVKMKEKLEVEINSIRNKLDNMYIDKLDNKITEEMYGRIQNKLNQEMIMKNDKLSEINSCLEGLDEKDTFNLIKNEIEGFKNKKPTRDLILKLIKYISIHEDGNIDIYFNFKELNFIYNNIDT